MLRQHRVGVGERRDGTRDAGHPGPAASGERYAFDRAIEQRRRRLGAPEDVTVAQPLAGGDDARAHAADASPGGAASSSARGRGIATTRSKRSSNARDTFSR